MPFKKLATKVVFMLRIEDVFLPNKHFYKLEFSQIIVKLYRGKLTEHCANAETFFNGRLTIIPENTKVIYLPENYLKNKELISEFEKLTGMKMKRRER